MATELLLALVTVFVGVAVVAGTMTARLLESQAPERQRIRRVIDAAGSSFVLQDLQVATALPPPHWQRISKVLPKSLKELGRLQRRFVLAGYHSFAAPALYGIAELALPLLGLVPLAYLGTSTYGLVFAGLAAMIGYMAPSIWLDWQVQQRKARIRDGLPDALDLLVVCLEAGSSIDQAIVKTSTELEIAYPDLANEFRTIITETRAGKPRLEAFKGFAERTRLDQARALASMLVQTERFGTSVAQALRAHADAARVERRQTAEERAAKIGVKLVFPLVICLFPALYVVLLGPAVLEFMRAFP